MGLESFQLALYGGRLQSGDLVRELRIDPAISTDRGLLSSSVYLLRDDGLHKIEMEVDDIGTRLSLRFALCHPTSIDDVFLSLVKTYQSQFGMEFDRPDFEDEGQIRQEIAMKRADWQLQFGTVTKPATSSEVFEWFIKPHCVTGSRVNGHHQPVVVRA
jgi:hypothetical protein